MRTGNLISNSVGCPEADRVVLSLAIVSAGDFAHEVEPEPRPSGRAGNGEPLEQVRNQLGRNPGPGVGDPDAGPRHE